MKKEDRRIIHAEPTKEFFIDMLVKDIELTGSIIDLVDNCVDGATRIRPDLNYEGLEILIEANPELFRISDNCGGISVELAEKYAFRFGRPADMDLIPYSIGQFGVGMKRAIFKMGTKFRIKSTTENSQFVVEEDVNDWKEKEKWEFHFSELDLERAPVPPDQRGTIITVDYLHDSVAKKFGLPNFINELRIKIKQAHQMTLDKGIAISLNGIPVEFNPLTLLYSNKLKPVFIDEKIPQTGNFIGVKIYAGIEDSIPREGGWYIYCNGRMIIGPDQTILTGWGQGSDNTIPKYHNQFARFRGFVFFHSVDASLLPWNTTKTGVDADSAIYRSVRQKMIILMRPVIDFLNKLKEEKEVKKEEKEDPVFPFPDVMWNPARWIRH